MRRASSSNGFEVVVKAPTLGLYTRIPGEQPDPRAATSASNVRFAEGVAMNAPGYGVLVTNPALPKLPVLFQQTVFERGGKFSTSVIVGTADKLYSLFRYPESTEVQATLSFSSLSATPQLVGFSEFANPSTPPKKYLRKDGNGIITRNDYSFNPGPDYCQGPCSGGSDAQSFEGYDSYSASTGAFEVHSLQRVYQNSSGCPPTNQVNAVPGLPATFGTSGVDPNFPYNLVEYTKTEAFLTGLENCVPSPSEGGRIKYAFGERRMELSNEDTEENAMARATYVSGTSGTAVRQQRTAGAFSFAHTRVTGTVYFTNLIPGFNYRLRYRTIASPAVPGAQIIGTHAVLFAAPSGSHSLELPELPCPSGYSCVYSDVSVELEP